MRLTPLAIINSENSNIFIIDITTRPAATYDWKAIQEKYSWQLRSGTAVRTDIYTPITSQELYDIYGIKALDVINLL